MAGLTLYTSPASPFGRKVAIALTELGMDNAVKKIDCNPWESGAELLAANPLSKIPTLVLEDGTALYDSGVVCEHLNARDGRHRLLPADPAARVTALRRQALADGMLDAAIIIMLNRAQKPERVHRGFVVRQEQIIARAFEALEKEAQALHGHFDLGHVAIVCALDFMSHSNIAEWRDQRPKLAQWLDAIHKRPSVARNPAVAVAPAR
jgi:glutathione S-transferase